MTNTKWQWRPLGDLFDIGAGKTMSEAARAGADKVPFLRTSNVFWDQIDLSEVDEMAMSPSELEGKSLKRGDLLVCEGGEIGRAAVWDGQIALMSFQNHLHRLRPRRPDVDPQFYVYFLQSAFTQLGIFEGAGNKTTIPNLSRNRLAALDVPLPPFAEQRGAADALRAVRAAVALQAMAMATATELKRAAMRDLFSRGLNSEEQKETEIGVMPMSWDVVSLGSLGRVGNGSTPKKTVPSYWEGGTYPWLTSAKVYDREIVAADQFVTQDALRECHLPRIAPGAVLIAITGQGKTLGNCAVLRTEATVSQHIAYLATDTSRADPSFIRGYLETQYESLRQVASGGGSTKGALTCAFLRELPLPLPSLEEQREIVAILDALDKKIALHQRKREVLEELFRSLLYKLMTGEIGVSQMDLAALASTEPEAAA